MLLSSEGAEDMAQWLRALAVLPQDLPSILSTWMVALSCLYAWSIMKEKSIRPFLFWVWESEKHFVFSQLMELTVFVDDKSNNMHVLT